MTARTRLALGSAFALLLGTAIGAVRVAPVVPAPDAVLGFEPCADRRLATYEEIARYFAALDAASDRVVVTDIGQTVAGRRQILAAISSEANLRALDRHKATVRSLALARGLTDERARALAREGRAIVWIDFGLHSSELAHAQAAPLLAWRVATEDSEEMRAIRDQVILVLVPNMNPDGTTLWADWYRQHVGTEFERSALPVLYHPYGGHDNNRDWFMFNMPESRNVARQLYAEWLPQIVYNQHQEAPFPARIFIPPFDDPMNPNIPPLVVHGIAAVGEAMARRFEREGKSGAISRLGFDTWWNGGMRTAPYFHNMVGILTETAHSSPAPATYDASTFPAAFSNGTPTLQPSTVYPRPWAGGTWRFRDSCDYMVTASVAVLDVGARRRESWLYDAYQMGRDAIRAGAEETYVLPAQGWDPAAASRLVDALLLAGIEVDRAAAPFQAAGEVFGAGTYVIRGAQPFRAYVTDVLNPQVYPDRRRAPGGPPIRPYDVTGWTLPLQMGVRVVRVPDRLDVRTEPVRDRAPRPDRTVPRAGFGYAIDARSNDAYTFVNRAWRAGDTVRRLHAPLTVDGDAWPPGTFVVVEQPGTHERMIEAARGLAVRWAALDAAPPDAGRPMSQPRVGLYRAWGGNADEGWTRWVLDQHEFPFTPVRDADIRAGRLVDRFDVIVLPDATYDAMLRGLAPGSTPPEYVGGMTPRGVASLFEFVSAGGTLVTLDSASGLPLTAFGLPATDVTAGLPAADFYAPGSIVRLKLDPTHPLAFGLPEETGAFFNASHAFEVGRRRTRAEQRAGEPPADVPGIRVVGTYASDRLLMSGWLLGEATLTGRAAVVDARIDAGRVVLIGFRPQHRGQSHGTFKLLFNALLLGATKEPDERRPGTGAPDRRPR